MIPKVWRLSYLGYMAILILGMVIGAQWYRLYLFPFPQLHNWVNSYEENVPLSTRPVITKYAPQVPVFLDKLYFDSVGDKRLDGLFLVQIPRHYSENIEINARTPVTIYRFISDDNVNTQFDSWASSDIPIHVQGKTTKHTRVVKKNFPAGTITLPPGGPVASSPILIEVPSQTEALPLEFEVLDLEMYTNASVR